jgi:hypothetical protein
MAGTVMPAPKFIGLDNNANPVSGGKLYTYVAGTTTPQPTYSDVNLTVANANPVVLDSAGRATVFLSGSSYKFVLTDANDVPIWTQDNVQAVAPFSTNLDIQGVAGETILAGQACYLSDGSGALTAGRWYLADADNAYSSSLPQIAIAPDAIDTGETGTFRLQGSVTKANAQADFVVGSTYYIAGTAGLLSLTPGTNQRIMGQADSTTTIVISPNPPNVAVTPTFVNGITVTSTDGGASAGPSIDLYRDSASPAASDQIGEVRFSGEDSAGNKQLYARIYGQIADATSTTEDGQVRVAVVSNGTETLMLVLTESGAFIPDLTTQDLGTGAKPWRNVFLSGTGKLDFGNGDVTVTASSNTLTFAGAASGYVFNDGNVGIGVTPTSLLHLRGSAPTLTLDDSGNTTAAISYRPQAASYAERGRLSWDLVNAEMRLAAGASGGSFFQTFYTNGAERMRIDANGNVGIGVTPSAWQSTRRVLQIGGSGSIWTDTSGMGFFFMLNNGYFDGTNYKYLHTDEATYYAQTTGGDHSFATAPSGTAGNNITFTDRFRVLNGGNIAIGSTARIYLDGVAGTGGTYIHQNTTNQIQFVGGNTTMATATTNAVVSAGAIGVGFASTGGGTSTGTAIVRNADTYFYLTSSSRRFKENIAPAVVTDAQLDAFIATTPSWWDYTGQKNGALGFIAEDLAALPLDRYGFNPLVNYDGDGQIESNRDYALIAMHHLVIQRLERKIAALEARIH